MAVACYQAVECEGMARVDFLLEAATGLPYSALIDRLIELALERHAVKQATRYRR